jgi:hypothetical protein
VIVAVTLPYEFDTSPVVKLVLRAVLGLLILVVVPGILYSLFVTHDWVALVQLVLIGATVGYFGMLFGRHLTSTTGIISKEVVVIWPVTVFGIRVSGPEGRFSMAQFRAVRVESISPAASMQSRQHERVSLIGRDGAPDILVARTENHAGKTFGRELASTLDLEYEERTAAY